MSSVIASSSSLLPSCSITASLSTSPISLLTPILSIASSLHDSPANPTRPGSSQQLISKCRGLLLHHCSQWGPTWAADPPVNRRKNNQVLLASNLIGKAHSQLFQLSCLLTECCNLRQWSPTGMASSIAGLLWVESQISESLPDAFESTLVDCSPSDTCSSAQYCPAMALLQTLCQFLFSGKDGCHHVACLFQLARMSNTSFSRCYNGFFTRGCSTSTPNS